MAGGWWAGQCPQGRVVAESGWLEGAGSPGWSGGWRAAGGGCMEAGGWRLEGAGKRMAVWLGWCGGYSVWRIAAEPMPPNSAILFNTCTAKHRIPTTAF